MRCRRVVAWMGVALSGLWTVSYDAHAARGDEIKPAADAPRPHPPEVSRRRFKLPDGFDIQLVAAEPHLADPVAMAFDERGRIFVCEIHGYNLDGHLDVIELNKTGKLDKTVRRIPANPDARRRAEQQTYGTVKLLEDTNDDGVIDRASVWADRLGACYGVVPARGGVIVLCAPDIVFLADRDDDGQVEVREKLFTGFGADELWTRINNPRWGPDNWIYATMGARCAGTIRGPRLPGPVEMGNTHFRFKSDGSAIEPVGGDRHGFGLTLTDFGDRFFLTNSAHALYAVPLEHRYLARNPYYAAPGPVENAADYDRVFPISRPHPWRLARSRQPAWMKFYGAREATANGYFTAACGPMIYRADAFPPAYRGNHFSCDSQQNLVHRCLLERYGNGYTVRRAPGQEQSEFLASTEGWFRPVNLTLGPDGAIYVVDMYREIIEDYSAIPRYLQQQYGLIKGNDRGRIWRVFANDAPKTEWPNLADATAAALVEHLAHAHAWWRLTAGRLLIERGEKSIVPRLARLVKEGKTAPARLHALYTLDGLGALASAHLDVALDDAHFGVRVHALRLADARLTDEPRLLDRGLKMIDDADSRVRLQAALTLGEADDPRVARALARLAVEHGGDRWMRAAVMSSASATAFSVLEAIVASGHEADARIEMAGELSAMIGARGDDGPIARLLELLAERGHDAPLQTAALNNLRDALKRGKPHKLASADGREALRRLMTRSKGQVRSLALQVAGALQLGDSPLLRSVFAQATAEATDDQRPVDQRTAAMKILAGAPYATLAPTARKLLDPRRPLAMQLAAVAALGEAHDPNVAEDLLAGWAGYTPPVRDAVLDVIFSRTNRLDALLSALDEGVIAAAGLGAFQRLQLIENPDPRIAARAEKLLAGPAREADRREIIDRFVAALQNPGNATEGHEVFETQCAKCHQINGKGHAVGPDLSSAMNRSDEALILEILQPNRQITTGFVNYVVTTKAGEILTGLLNSETATGVTLIQAEGVKQTILRKDIDTMRASRLSLMPQNVDELINPKQAADLLAYLREVFGSGSPQFVCLFDDEAAFPALLNQGGGTVTLNTDDRFSGTASLAVTPLQRHSSRIPGWSYRIRETPGPGEFRFLRLAWKSRRGDGIMIELAADGSWPAPDSPRRRYYSGKNTSDWRALRVADRIPERWTVLTVDLWKDCGAFTLTGIAPTALGGVALFDRIGLFRSMDTVPPGR